MPSAGELLRSERLKRNRTLAEIAAQTCISRRYLEAIETDSTKDLPGEFFYKAFIRQYAGALELDDSTTEHILSSAVPLNDPDPVPVLSQVYERAHTGEPNRWRPATPVAVGLLFAVLAGGSLLYAWWQQRSQATPESEPRPSAQESTPLRSTPEPAPVQQPAAAAPESQPAAPVTAPGAAPSTQPSAAAPPSPAPASSAPPLTLGQPGIEISATEAAWVQVQSDGKTLFIGTLEPNQPRQFPVGANATLRTGNAGAVDVRFHGNPLGPLGPKGQVRVVRFTPQGAEIVPPKPKPVPAATTPVQP